MKVGIVTVYHAYNCGSFLQAFAMQRVLRGFGYETIFIRNRQPIRSTFGYRLIQAAGFICRRDIHTAIHLLAVPSNFRKAQKCFQVTAKIQNMDAVVYGSDTIWNTDQAYFLKHWKRFYGLDYCGRKVGYAVSIGSADMDALCRQPHLCKAVGAFDAIAVRDAATAEFVMKVRGAEQQVPFVVDPTMLLSKEEYMSLAPPISDRDYILFYYFSAIPENIKRQVQAFATATNRKIILMGQKQSGVDQCVPNDPFLMLSYYIHADYVITNTFHGNIFSLIFNKQFISLGKEKQKVCDLLDRYGLAHRLVDEDDCITELFGQRIDFEEINRRTTAASDLSKEYLHHAVYLKDGLK